jgi:xylulokinase
MGVMLSAAGSLRWLRDVAASGVAYDALTAAAGAWPPGTEGLVFLTALRALRSV